MLAQIDEIFRVVLLELRRKEYEATIADLGNRREFRLLFACNIHARFRV
jgi:hypothetical protein